MEQHEIMEKLKPILSPYTKDAGALDRINRETSFIQDLKINSANLVDIVLDVEETFDIEIDNDSMGQMQTVGAAIDIVQSKQASL
jgi:acyl carrier protein